MIKSKYVTIMLTGVKPKTSVYSIISKSSCDELGIVKWYAPWRQYCFFPTEEFGTIWARNCLKDVIAFIEELMDARTKEALCA